MTSGRRDPAKYAAQVEAIANATVLTPIVLVCPGCAYPLGGVLVPPGDVHFVHCSMHGGQR